MREACLHLIFQRIWDCNLCSLRKKEKRAMAIINGRRIQVPPSGITGQNLIQQMNPGPGRRPVIQQGTVFRPVQASHTYKPDELFDSHGNPVKLTTIPDRTKGMVTYGGDRTFLSKQLITEQVYDIAEKLFKKGVSFDEEHADWMIANQYVLPPHLAHHCQNDRSVDHLSDRVSRVAARGLLPQRGYSALREWTPVSNRLS